LMPKVPNLNSMASCIGMGPDGVNGYDRIALNVKLVNEIRATYCCIGLCVWEACKKYCFEHENSQQ
jgi:hypothetical protein